MSFSPRRAHLYEDRRHRTARGEPCSLVFVDSLTNRGDWRRLAWALGIRREWAVACAAKRIGFVETIRAVGLSAGQPAATTVRDEWPAFGVIEVDQRLADNAAKLAITRELRSMDALHLAAALMLPREDLLLATWDRRLHTAAMAEGLVLIPETLT
jgi:predicted nucleic acid-binding protein